MNNYKKPDIKSTNFKSVNDGVPHFSSLKQSFPINKVNYPSQNQRGVALVAVLMVLLLISIVAAVSIRSSNTNLRISLANQADELLFLANDFAFERLEKEDQYLEANSNSNQITLKSYMANPIRKGHEISLCMRPDNKLLFSLYEMSEINENGQLLNNSGTGYCDTTKKEDYVNEGRVVTQLTFVQEPDTAVSGKLFSTQIEGTSSNDFELDDGGGSRGGSNSANCNYFVGYATSVIPALSNASESEINACLKKSRIINSDDNVDTCLTNLGVPHQTQTQVYRSKIVGVNCI